MTLPSLPPTTVKRPTGGSAALVVCFDCDRRIYRNAADTAWVTLDDVRKCAETGKAHRTPAAAVRAIRNAENPVDHTAQEG